MTEPAEVEDGGCCALADADGTGHEGSVRLEVPGMPRDHPLLGVQRLRRYRRRDVV